MIAMHRKVKNYTTTEKNFNPGFALIGLSGTGPCLASITLKPVWQTQAKGGEGRGGGGGGGGGGEV